MSELTIWRLQDILIILALVFNAGGLVYTVRNHIKTVKKEIVEVKQTLEKECKELKQWCIKLTGEVHDLGERVSRLEGRVNTYHEGG